MIGRCSLSSVVAEHQHGLSEMTWPECGCIAFIEGGNMRLRVGHGCLGSFKVRKADSGVRRSTRVMKFVEKSETKSDGAGDSFQGLLTNAAPAVSMYVPIDLYLSSF